MKALITVMVAMAVVLTGCGGKTGGSTPNDATADSPTTVGTNRSYSGTASVGDFLTLNIDAATHTITYTNVSNGDNGTATYSVGSDGIYTINDPTGNLVAAYEVPNYALLIEAKRTGPDHSTPSLITAVVQNPISLATLKNHKYNYMQFRTTAGGMEVGTVTLDADGNTRNSSYWPYGALGMGQAPNPFNTGYMPASGFQPAALGTYLTFHADNSGTDYIFGTANGVFAVDTPNGAILGFEKAATKNFEASTMAGTYKAVYYLKKAANTGAGNVETGLPVLNQATVTVGSDGHLKAVDSQGATLLDAMLTPVADASYLYDGSASKLADGCYGMFTFRIIHGDATEDTFVTFVNGTMLFALFSSTSDAGPGYDYVYGVGLK